MAAAVLRKRKIIDTHWGDDHCNAQQPQWQARQQSSITRFGRVGKPTAVASPASKCSTPVKSESGRRNAILESQGETKKRKLQHTAPPETASLEPPARPVTPPPAIEKADRKPKSKRLPPSKPGEPRRIAPLKGNRHHATDSPTQGARAILEAFVLAPTSQERETSPTPARTKEDGAHQELVSLHAAFLNALSLHYAHEGTSTPADLRQLTPSIARIWRRRRVTTEDVRRVLGVQQSMVAETSREGVNLPELTIVDFGQGKVGIEYEASTSSTHMSPLPIASLKRIFAANLLALDQLDLPLAPITAFVPTAELTRGKGAVRLADLKASALNAQANTARSAGRRIGLFAANSPEGEQVAAAAKPALRSASLLARVCAKEVHAASQPAPSAAAQRREAALQRLEDVIPVIEVLIGRNGGGNGGATGSMGSSSAARDLASDLGLDTSLSGLGLTAPRPPKTVSLTFPTLVQHLQNSLRHPIAKEEAELCIRLIADDVLPWWASIRGVGKVETVCFRGAVGRREWMARIRAVRE
jgi:DNA replication factor Cdt1 C-terminal domain